MRAGAAFSRRRGRSLALVCALSAGGAGFPAVAEAGWYLSLRQAERVTRHNVSGTDTLAPRCRPRDAANTRRNKRLYDWHRWICDWSGAHTNAAGARGTCRGSLYVTGRRHGRARVKPRLPVACSYPSSAPTAQQILDHTSAFAKGVGEARRSAVTSTYKWEVSNCKLAQEDTGRCTVWLFHDDGIAGYDQNGNEVHGVSLYRVYAFSEWVVSTVVWNDYVVDTVEIAPAQTCQRVDYPDGTNAYVNCSTPTPDP